MPSLHTHTPYTHCLLLLLLLLSPRWYGPGEPGKVFMERKTHREGWKVRGGCAVVTALWPAVVLKCRRYVPCVHALLSNSNHCGVPVLLCCAVS